MILANYIKSFLWKKISLRYILDKNFSDYFNVLIIGANDGKSFDFLYDFLSGIRLVEGIAIEPLEKYYDDLKVNFSKFNNLKTLKCAVHTNENQVGIYKVREESLHKYPDWAKGINSLFKDHHLKTNINKEDIDVEYCEARNLQSIIESDGQNKHFDLIQIDVEGYDYEILKMIDFDILSAKIIKYEHCNLSEMDRNEASALLRKKKFQLFQEGTDTVAINLSKIRL